MADAALHGAAGRLLRHLEFSDGVAHWHRAFDYRPDAGVADKGRLKFQGDILVEHGVETPYVEHWRRAPEAVQYVAALRLDSAGSNAPGCLVSSSNAFIYARSRAKPLPPDTNLSQLLNAAASLEQAQDLFDCEISFGRRGSRGWKIERSSLPFREGRMLAPEVDEKVTTFSVDDLTPQGVAIRRSWKVTSWESTHPGTLSDWFPAAGALKAPAMFPGSTELADELERSP